MARDRIYFVSDVHLGLDVKDPEERESRFVSWLDSIPRESAKALYLLGDIWDFWYEYRDVVPRTGARVVARLTALVDSGIEVYFFEGNHDIWTFSFFEELGMKKRTQPYYMEEGGKIFCIGHGDGLGKVKRSYRLMLDVFRSKVAQTLFSTLHPWLAYRFAMKWSGSNRRSHSPYTFKGPGEPLYEFVTASEENRHADFYIFGHYHDRVDMTLPSGSRLLLLKDWMDGGCPCAVYDSSTCELRFSDGLLK